MNKGVLTNITALLLAAAGYIQQLDWLMWIGVFALSGALTNALAIHMLFEKVPGLIGSGVIPNQFESFKSAIKDLMMNQFFRADVVENFIDKQVESPKFQLEPVIEQVDLAPAFQRLVDVIMQSSFGSMLGMFGGASALTSLQEPFETNMRVSLIELSHSDTFKALLEQQMEQPESIAQIQSQIEQMIQSRLDELTPEMVKEMLLQLMRDHLSWLVVWGGVFGGVIGGLSAFLIA